MNCNKHISWAVYEQNDNLTPAGPGPARTSTQGSQEQYKNPTWEGPEQDKAITRADPGKCKKSLPELAWGWRPKRFWVTLGQEKEPPDVSQPPIASLSLWCIVTCETAGSWGSRGASMATCCQVAVRHRDHQGKCQKSVIKFQGLTGSIRNSVHRSQIRKHSIKIVSGNPGAETRVSK